MRSDEALENKDASFLIDTNFFQNISKDTSHVESADFLEGH